MTFYYHTLHILTKALFFIFCLYNIWIFNFCIFSTLQTIRWHCFIHRLKDSMNCLVFSFILSYSFYTLFIKTNSSWMIFESTKAFEIETSVLVDLVFANKVILSCFFFFFLILDIYFLILASTAQILSPIYLSSIYFNIKQGSKSRYKKTFNINEFLTFNYLTMMLILDHQ